MTRSRRFDEQRKLRRRSLSEPLALAAGFAAAPAERPQDLGHRRLLVVGELLRREQHYPVPEHVQREGEEPREDGRDRMPGVAAALAAEARLDGVAGGRATPDLVDALAALQHRLAPADDGDDVDARVRDALGSEGALLRSCAVFDCALAGALFPLHAVGTTLGAARPAAPPKDATL